MTRKQIEARWARLLTSVKVASKGLYSALSGEWLSKVTLRDTYSENRPDGTRM